MTNTVEPDATASMTDDLLFWKARAKSYQARLSAVEAENEKLREALLDVYPLAVVHAANYARIHDAQADFVPQHADLFLRIAQLLGAPELEKVARNAFTKGKDDG